MTRRIIIAVVALVATAATLNAQPEHNDSLRTTTWSFYLQGGVSGFHGMRGPEGQYDGKNYIAPSGELGFMYFPRPWLRFGLGLGYHYLKTADNQILKRVTEFPDYKMGDNTGTLTVEEARMQNINITNAPYADLNMGINFIEIWRERDCQWFNMWLNLGAGYMHGWNQYTTTWARNSTFVATDGTEIHDTPRVESPIAKNQFNGFYIPVGASIEFDVIPQLTIAAVGQYKYFPISSIQHTPTGIWTAALALRYNIVGRRQGFKSKNDRVNDLESELRYYRNLKPTVDTVIVEKVIVKEPEPAPVVAAPVAASPVAAPTVAKPPVVTTLQVVDKPLTNYAVQIYAFRIYKHAPNDKIFFGDNPTIFINGDLRRYVVFTTTLDEAKIKLAELKTRYHDAFIVYIDEDGIVVPYKED